MITEVGTLIVVREVHELKDCGAKRVIVDGMNTETSEVTFENAYFTTLAIVEGTDTRMALLQPG